MSNGRPWTAADTETLKALAGRKSAWAIAQRTGHSVHTIRDRTAAMGLPTFKPGRTHWNRRDWLLADASGLDFQMSPCR